MGNKDKSLKRCYKKKKVFHSNRYTQITAKSTTSSTQVLAGTTRNASTSYDSSDVSTSLSARRLKLNVTNRDVSDNESHFDSNGANIYKNIQHNSQMEEVVNDNIDKYDSENNSVNGESISNFNRSRFYEERESSYWLLIHSDILENIIDLIGKCPAERCCGKVKY